MQNLVAIRPVSVLLIDIMPKPRKYSAVEKRIENICRVVHTYNSAHLPVAHFFKRITSGTNNNDEIYTICETFHKALANDHKYTVMLAETMCNVLAYDLCRLEKIKYNEVLSLEAATREIISYEIKLSHRYELLAKILRRSEMLARECHLTAFSLNPAWRNYMTLVNFHKQYESSKRYQSLDGFNSILGAPTIEHNEYDPKANPVQSMLEGDKLATQLSKSDLWDDLASVITNPRIKTLRWSTNNWTELRQLCQHIHDEPDYKMCLIRQNVAAPDRNGLWYARQNNRELAKRLLHRTINKLAYRKSKWQRRKYVCCFEASSGLKGFVQM